MPEQPLASSDLPVEVERGTAIVTGGRRGIGAAIAIALAREGFSVVIVDLDQDEAADATLHEISRNRGNAHFLRADISDTAGHAELIAHAVRKYGPLTCLVNNAGRQVPVRGDLLEATPDVFDQLISTNLRGTFFLTQAAARVMIADPAPGLYRSIITVSSANATMASPEKASYCLSKAALSMMVKLFATRLATHAIDVFEIQPGIIRTDMTKPVWDSYGKAIEAGLVPNRRWGQPEDIGAVVATLACGRLPFSTGTVIPVGGGLHIPRI